jgi:hypothetical protein
MPLQEALKVGFHNLMHKVRDLQTKELQRLYALYQLRHETSIHRWPLQVIKANKIWSKLSRKTSFIYLNTSANWQLTDFLATVEFQAACECLAIRDDRLQLGGPFNSF